MFLCIPTNETYQLGPTQIDPGTATNIIAVYHYTIIAENGMETTIDYTVIDLPG